MALHDSRLLHNGQRSRTYITGFCSFHSFFFYFKILTVAVSFSVAKTVLWYMLALCYKTSDRLYRFILQIACPCTPYLPIGTKGFSFTFLTNFPLKPSFCIRVLGVKPSITGGSMSLISTPHCQGHFALVGCTITLPLYVLRPIRNRSSPFHDSRQSRVLM